MHRVVFHEITKRAINEAIEHPETLSMDLVNAQQARRALDYLVGFNLSPLLWKKIRRGLSAGRVQSPALRMIVEREQEIEAFKTQEYWTIEAGAHRPRQQAFRARLTHYDGEEARTVQHHRRGAGRRPFATRLLKPADGWLTVPRWKKSSASAIRPRRSRPRPCNRRRRASWVSPPAAP